MGQVWGAFYLPIPVSCQRLLALRLVLKLDLEGKHTSTDSFFRSVSRETSRKKATFSFTVERAFLPSKEYHFCPVRSSNCLRGAGDDAAERC